MEPNNLLIVFSFFDFCCKELIIGILSSILTLIILFFIKPSIGVSTKISSKPLIASYRIKIINKSYFYSFINIKAELQIINVKDNGLESSINIHLRKHQLFEIPRNRLLNNEYRNAYRFISNTKIVQMIANQGDRFKCLRFKIIATNSFTNFSKVKVIEYKMEDIEIGYFDIGNSLKVLPFN